MHHDHSIGAAPTLEQALDQHQLDRREPALPGTHSHGGEKWLFAALLLDRKAQRLTDEARARTTLVRRFKQAIDRAGVHLITFHELRYTFGTRMAAAGTPMRTLQHWMAHADSKTTQIYAHYQPSEGEAEAVDRAFG